MNFTNFMNPMNPLSPMNPISPTHPMNLTRRNRHKIVDAIIDATTDMANNLTGYDILLAVGIAAGITLVMAAIVYIFVKKDK